MKAKCEAVVTGEKNAHREARFYVEGKHVLTLVLNESNWDAFKEGEEYELDEIDQEPEAVVVDEPEGPTDHG